MNKKNNSKNHHYIPQFFLRSFAQKDGKKYIINIFDKKNLNKFYNSVDNIGYIKKFHTVKVDGKETDFIEKAHNIIFEKDYSIAYRNILKKIERVRQDICVLNCLSQERYMQIYMNEQFEDSDKIFFSFLLSYFIIRGKKWRRFGEEVYKKKEKIIREFGRAYYIKNIEESIKKEIGEIEDVKMAQLKATFQGEEIEMLASYLYKHSWNIGLNMTDDNIYTSDNIHALTTMWKDQPACYGIGYSTYGNTIIFPISPKICILMFDYIYTTQNNIKIIDKSYVKLNGGQVKIINNEIVLSALDQVYSIDGNWNDLDNCYKTNNLRKGHKSYKVQ